MTSAKQPSPTYLTDTSKYFQKHDTRNAEKPSAHYAVPLTLIVTLSLQKEKLPYALLEELRKISASKIKNPQLEVAGNLVISIPIQVVEIVYGAPNYEQACRIAVGRYRNNSSCVVVESPKVVPQVVTTSVGEAEASENYL